LARKRRLGRPVDQKGRSKGGEQYAPLSYALLHTAAWRSLSGPAVKVFLELRTRFHGANNGQLIFSLDEGKRLLGLGKTTVQRALTELQAKSLIVLHTQRPVVRPSRPHLGNDRPTIRPCTRLEQLEGVATCGRIWLRRASPKNRSRSQDGSVADSCGPVSGPVRPIRVAAMGPVAGRQYSPWTISCSDQRNPLQRKRERRATPAGSASAGAPARKAVSRLKLMRLCCLSRDETHEPETNAWHSHRKREPKHRPAPKQGRTRATW
jgi:hypothetical protein